MSLSISLVWVVASAIIRRWVVISFSCFILSAAFFASVTNRIFKIRFYPIKDVNGGISIQSIHILEDITEAKKAADNIKQEKEITTHLLMIAEATTHTSDIDKLMGEVTHCSHKIIGCNICLS